MGCVTSSHLEARLAEQQATLEGRLALAEKMDGVLARLDGAAISMPALAPTTTPAEAPGAPEDVVVARVRSRRALLRTAGFDIFVSHAKKLPDSEDRAVWVADLCEAYGWRPFFDRSDLVEITEPSLKAAMLNSEVCVTVLDPHTFNSLWVLKENLLAANAGIPIICVFDSDRFRWNGQLDKWLKLHPWIFGRQVVPVTKTQRRTTTDALISAIAKVRGACVVCHVYNGGGSRSIGSIALSQTNNIRFATSQSRTSRRVRLITNTRAAARRALREATAPTRPARRRRRTADTRRRYGSRRRSGRASRPRSASAARVRQRRAARSRRRSRGCSRGSTARRPR